MLLLGSALACNLFVCDPESLLITAETILPAQQMGSRRGMMERHHASIPEEYARLQNPVLAEEQSLLRGEEIFSANCAVCHGESGMGDGPGGLNLDPPPAPIAHTSLMLSDAYLFWRISEGGVDYGTAMPVYKLLLDENSRWDVINYIRSLGSQQVIPGPDMMGEGDVFEQQVQIREQMLDDAVGKGVISQIEADTFARVHFAIDNYLLENPAILQGKGMDAMIDVVLSEMVNQNLVSAMEADDFLSVHETIENAGLMR
jgi:mono/diheme cytochrome c family protein